MKLPYNEFLAVVYADLFSFPLTRAEAKLWAINTGKKRGQDEGQKTVTLREGYLTLPRRAKLVPQRLERLLISQRKYLLAQTVATALARIPSLSAIFLTGSVATKNAKEEADIDLMIVTPPHFLWTTRFLVVAILKLANLYRSGEITSNKFCTNIYLDRNHLTIANQNLYTAHEVLQAKCLIDKGDIEKQWLRANSWTKIFLSQRYKEAWATTKKRVSSPTPTLSLLSLILLPLELLAFLVQGLYMKSKVTNESIDLGYAFFHPHDLSLIITQKFTDRLRKNRGKSVKIAR